MRTTQLCLCALLAVSFSVTSARADDATARTFFQAAQTEYQLRTGLDAHLEAALTAIENAEEQAEDDTLKFDILIFASRAYYFKGEFTKGDDAKKEFFAIGMNKAMEATDLNPDLSEGYYSYALNLSKWAIANGVIASLKRKGEVIGNCNSAMERVTRDGLPGNTTDGYGPNRILGRMYYKLPGFAGGSHARSVQYLKEAYDNAKNLIALNVVYYAETLMDGDANEKAEAKRILDELLAKDPVTFNPSRVPESREEFAMARDLRKSLGN